MQKETAPTFKELYKLKFDQDWWTDPPRVFLRVVDQEQLIDIAKLEIRYRINDLENRLEFYKSLPKI